MNECDILDRKKQLIDVLYNFDYCFSYQSLMAKLINMPEFNSLISRITNVKTKSNSTVITKKKYLSGNEQFLIMLYDYIYRFNKDFYFLNKSNDYIIELSLQRKRFIKYLFCKNYIGNNEFIPYFNYNYKRLVTYGFNYNIKLLAKYSDIIKEFTKNNDINICKNLLGSQDEIDKLYKLLIKMSCCNVKEFNNVLLFESIDEYNSFIKKKYCGDMQKLETATLSFYLIQWELMIENYNKKIDAVNILFD